MSTSGGGEPSAAAALPGGAGGPAHALNVATASAAVVVEGSEDPSSTISDLDELTDSSTEDEEDDDGEDSMEGIDMSNLVDTSASASASASVSATASAASAIKQHDVNSLPLEVLMDIFYHLEPDVLNKVRLVCKRWSAVTKDLRFRTTWFTRKYQRTEVLYRAMMRPKLASAELIQNLLDNGAHFSRYLTQIVVKSFAQADRQHSRTYGVAKLLPRALSFRTYSVIVSEAAKRYGDHVKFDRFQDDGESLRSRIFLYSRSKSASDWAAVVELFEDFDFMFFNREDVGRMEFVRQIAMEPRLAPLAVRNGLEVSPSDCEMILRSIFQDTMKTDREKADTIGSFLALDLPGLQLSPEVRTKILLHEMGDAVRVDGPAATRSSAYKALLLVAADGKLDVDLSREVAKLFVKKRLCRSSMEKLPYLHFLLEDFPEVLPLVPRKAALIKFLMHNHSSTVWDAYNIHDALDPMRPFLTQRLLVDVVANEFMTTALPLEWARDFLNNPDINIEQAALEALRKCMWHPCKGQSILALYDFVKDQDLFLRVLMEELRRWRIDLDKLEPDEQDFDMAYRDKVPKESHAGRVASLLAWNYSSVLMGKDECPEAYSQDPLDLRLIGKFTDFPGETTSKDVELGIAAMGSDEGMEPASIRELGNDHPSSSFEGVGTNGSNTRAIAAPIFEVELREQPIPDKNPFLGSEDPWAEDNLFYGSIKPDKTQYRPAMKLTECFPPEARSISEAVLELFGPHSEAADIIFAHALINNNRQVLDRYWDNMYRPSLMHLRLVIHLGRHWPTRVLSQAEIWAFRKRPYSFAPLDVRAGAKITSPIFCSSDAYPLLAKPGSAERTISWDGVELGEDESDDEELASWRDPRRRPGKTSAESRGALRAKSNKVPALSKATSPPPGGGRANAEPSTASSTGSVLSAAQASMLATAAYNARAQTTSPSSTVFPSAPDKSADSTITARPDENSIQHESSTPTNARGRPKRKAAVDVSYIEEEEDDVDDDRVLYKAHQQEVEALSGVRAKGAKGRPRLRPVATTLTPTPTITSGKASRAKKRKASSAVKKEAEEPSLLVLPADGEVKPAIPLPLLQGPYQLSSVAVLDVWARTKAFPAAGQFRTYEQHIKVAKHLESWLRHVEILLFAETKKYKERKKAYKADKLRRRYKMPAQRSMEMLQRNWQHLLEQIVADLDLHRESYLASMKVADDAVAKLAQRRVSRVNRLRSYYASKRLSAAPEYQTDDGEDKRSRQMDGSAGDGPLAAETCDHSKQSSRGKDKSEAAGSTHDSARAATSSARSQKSGVGGAGAASKPASTRRVRWQSADEDVEDGAVSEASLSTLTSNDSDFGPDRGGPKLKQISKTSDEYWHDRHCSGNSSNQTSELCPHCHAYHGASHTHATTYSLGMPANPMTVGFDYDDDEYYDSDLIMEELGYYPEEWDSDPYPYEF